MIERGIIFAERGAIDLMDLPFTRGQGIPTPPGQDDLRSAIRSFEKQHIVSVLGSCNYNKIAAAETLNIGLSSLYRKMDELGTAKNQEQAASGPQDGQAPQDEACMPETISGNIDP